MDAQIGIAGPGGERMGFTTTTRNRERKDEDHNLCASVHGCRDKIVVFDKQLWVVLANPELTDESKNEEHCERAVDADEQVAHIPENDRWVEVAPGWVFGVAVGNVRGNRNDEANQVGQCNPLVTRTHTEHFGCDAPCNRKSVELLDVLTGPDVCALNRLQDWSLILDNTVHHHPVWLAIRDSPLNICESTY